MTDLDKVKQVFTEIGLDFHEVKAVKDSVIWLEIHDDNNSGVINFEFDAGTFCGTWSED